MVMDTIYRMLNTSEGCFYLVQMLFALIPWTVSLGKLVKHYSFLRMLFFITLTGWCLIWHLELELLYEQTPLGMPNPLYLLLTIAINLFFLTGIQFMIKDTQCSGSILSKVLKGVLSIILSMGIWLGLILFVILPTGLFATKYLYKSDSKAWLNENEVNKKMRSDALPSFSYIPELSREEYYEDGRQQIHYAVLVKSNDTTVWNYVERLSKRKHSVWKLDRNDNRMKFQTSYKEDGMLYDLDIEVQHNDTILIMFTENDPEYNDLNTE